MYIAIIYSDDEDDFISQKAWPPDYYLALEIFEKVAEKNSCSADNRVAGREAWW